MRLVGQFETALLECKRQPYRLDSDEQKLELAKDIAGLANAKGGLILIGFATRKNATHGQDQIHRSRPFPLKAFDPDQYQQVIQSWLWPPPQNVDVRVFKLTTDNSRGVAAIIIPQVADENRPQLVAKTILDQSRQIEIVFGYCERKQSHVVHRDVGHLHTMLRDGLRFDTEIRLGFEALQGMIEGMATSPPNPPTTPEDVDLRIDTALVAAGRHEQPAFVLAAIPKRELNLRPLFEARDTPLVELLENPPRLRRSGFDLNVDINSRIIEGRLRRTVLEDFELLEFHRDGVAIYVAPGDGNRLCWGRSQLQRDGYLINQVALVEMTYLFCLLVKRLYEGHLRQEESFDLQMQLLRLSMAGRNFVLQPGALNGFGSGHWQPAPTGSMTFETDVCFGIHCPERMAVLLLSELYTWMGYEESRIPYTADNEGARVVDPEQIRMLGQ